MVTVLYGGVLPIVGYLLLGALAGTCALKARWVLAGIGLVLLAVPYLASGVPNVLLALVLALLVWASGALLPGRPGSVWVRWLPAPAPPGRGVDAVLVLVVVALLAGLVAISAESLLVGVTLSFLWLLRAGWPGARTAVVAIVAVGAVYGFVRLFGFDAGLLDLLLAAGGAVVAGGGVALLYLRPVSARLTG